VSGSNPSPSANYCKFLIITAARMKNRFLESLRLTEGSTSKLWMSCVQNGKITDHWGVGNLLSLMQIAVRTGVTTGNLTEVFGDLRAGDEVVLRGTDEIRSSTAFATRLVPST